MWSLRTAAKRVTSKTCGLRPAIIGSCCTGLELPKKNIDDKQYSTFQSISVIDHPDRISATRPLVSSGIFFHGRNLSSHVDTKLTDKEPEGLEGFSDLDSDADLENIEDELVSASDDVSADEEELKLKRSETPKTTLYGLVLNSNSDTLEESLDNWVKDGNRFKKEDVLGVAQMLRRKKLFGRAHQFMKWLEKSEHYVFTDVEYASLLDLHAKVHGLLSAEKFLEELPQSMQTEHTYRSLLARCVSAANVLKAEKIFNKMRDLNFPLSPFACNQLLLLYKRVDKKKIADVLLMMEKEDVKPTLFTYKVLIDAKGHVGDISAMEQLLNTMKEDGIEPDNYTKYNVAKHYIKGGIAEKAEKLAKELEGEDLVNNSSCSFLLDLYAQLGKPDEVDRVWKACRADPSMTESIEVMRAWAKFGKVENAEKVFEEMFKRFKKVSPMCYNCILRIYTDEKMIDKAKAIVERMSADGIRIGAETVDNLVRLYIEEGDLEKADIMLQNWAQKNQKWKVKPMYNTYLVLLEGFAKKGDYHNAEKILFLTKQMGYYGRVKMFELVLDAYINAKVPAYGFRDRLRAHNIFPGKILTSKLLAVDPFKKAPVTEMLE